MNETKQLAQFVNELKYEDLNPEVITKAKALVLDQLGCQLAFATLPWSQVVCQYVRDRNRTGESTVIYYGLRTTTEDAAFVNATFGHGFEMDDVEMHTITHPGSVVIPAALAMGEEKSASGKEFLTAVVVGYDVMLRIGKAARSMVDRSFHSTSVNGPFGAATATNKILQHDVDTIVNTLGIAASEAGGISEYTISGGSVKRLHSGFPAYAGVKAALLAQGGITGPVNAIEGKKGFCQAFANETHLEDITAGLGREFRIMWTGNKIYCCCAGQHTAIDATRAIMDTHAFQVRDIDEIIVEQMPREAKAVGNIIEPEDIIAAQFSGRFGIVIRLIKGGNGFSDYTLDNINNPEILELTRKIRYETNEKLEENVSEMAPAVVTIRLRNGDVLKKRIDYARGTIQNPLTPQELEDKFRGLASLSVPGQQVEEIIDIINQLEDVTDIQKLVSMLIIPDGAE